MQGMTVTLYPDGTGHFEAQVMTTHAWGSDFGAESGFRGASTAWPTVKVPDAMRGLQRIYDPPVSFIGVNNRTKAFGSLCLVRKSQPT
jgi:hypothetical protein